MAPYCPQSFVGRVPEGGEYLLYKDAWRDGFPFVQARPDDPVVLHPMHEVIVLGPGEGRAYEWGAMRGVFKADGEETGDAYCVSEWSVEPGGDGPGPHSHPEHVEVFLVTEGTMSFLVGDEWIDAPAGTFLRIPAGVTHDFRTAPTRRHRVQRLRPGPQLRGLVRLVGALTSSRCAP